MEDERHATVIVHWVCWI